MKSKKVWTAIELGNLKTLLGHVPFDFVCGVLFKHTVQEIREKALSLKLCHEYNFTAYQDDNLSDTLVELYNSDTDMFGVMVACPYNTTVEVLKHFEQRGVSLFEAEELFLKRAEGIDKQTPYIPYERISAILSKNRREGSSVEACRSLILDCNFEVLLCDVSDSYAEFNNYTVLAIYLDNLVLSKRTSEFAWNTSEYYGDLFNKKAIMPSNKENTNNKYANTENKKSVQVNKSEDMVYKTVEKSAEHMKEAEITKEAEKSVKEVEKTVNESKEIKSESEVKFAFDLFACSKRWTLEELEILVGYMSFMRVSDLLVLLPRWDEYEVTVKSKELKDNGITSVDKLFEVARK